MTNLPPLQYLPPYLVATARFFAKQNPFAVQIIRKRMSESPLRFAGKDLQDGKELLWQFFQHPHSKNSKWVGRRVCEFPNQERNLLLMIHRGDEKIIPNGNTILENGDILVLFRR